MFILIAVLFILTLALGVYLLSYILTKKNTPKGVALIHGSLGFVGIVILFIFTFFYPLLLYPLILFILAASGGFFLFTWDLLGKKIPKALALGHGLIAIVGFIVLCLVFYKLKGM